MFKGIYHLLIQNTICCQYFWCTGIGLVIIMCIATSQRQSPKAVAALGGHKGELSPTSALPSDMATEALRTRQNSLISAHSLVLLPDPFGQSHPPCSLSTEQLPGQQRLWGRFNCDLMSSQNKALVPFCVDSRSPNKWQCTYFIRLRWLAIFFFSQYERGKGRDSQC